ncbi:coiled-coil domain-containing protein 57-like [Mercenaria mercenaria]|uniref:coiled-coil domain-containing protein 57-like n=1 Tax=Mercenaria mercenaria TaxID=6596 RepID=UPI00234E753B|nr:coiled-coil domain-containing protein 57-like [Mercenaria mercenaria]
MDGGTNEADHWREVAAQKEKEWKQVTEQRINALEHACQEKERQLTEQREKFQKLKEDFKYNLRLLEQRDQELDRYDATFSDIKAQLNAKNAEVSECKIHVDELRTQVNCEVKSREELQLHYQARLREKQAEIDSYRNTKDGEIQEERKEFESFKRKLQRQLTQVEEEMDAQKRELTTGFEEAMRKREHEFRLQADEMSAKVLEHELKAKLLSKELDLVRSAQEKNSQEFEHVENNHRALEKKLKEKDWELQDLRAMKDANISDLENQLQQKESAMKRLQEDFERKHSEMDKFCREKENTLSTAKEAFADRESELQKEIRDLTSKLEDAQVEIRKLQWASQDLEKEKNTYIEKLQVQSQELKDKWDKQIGCRGRRNVLETEEEMAQLHEQNENLKMVIKEMRSQMEQLGHEIPVSKVELQKDSNCAEDYVTSLEKECRNLRKKNRELEQEADVSRRFGRAAAPPTPANEDQVLTEVKDNILVKNHIQSLNEIIGSLRGEKVDLSAQLKKQQAHLLFQEKTIENIKKQRKAIKKLRKVKYELGAATRRSHTELSSLRQKVSELELQLLEARKEADEYYRSNLERNMEVTALDQELSNLKLQLAEKRPGINYGAQVKFSLNSQKCFKEMHDIQRRFIFMDFVELQYAQKYQSPETDEYRPSSILKKPSTFRDSMDTEVDVRASVNTEGGETVASMRSVPDTARSQLMMSMSSMGGESLQEVWRMLEEARPSPTPRLSSPHRRSTQDENYNSNETAKDTLYLSGKPTGHQRPRSEKKLSDKASGKVFKKVQQPSVRNYNIRDDRAAR